MAVERCSTPFGIGDWFTEQYRFHICGPSSAQRLSASEIGSLVAVIAALTVLMCSTPFGIGDWFTRSPSGGRQRDLVLNAFRHRRLVHARSFARCTISTRSAQRLSASEIGSPRFARSRSRENFSCAQRLSASEIGSHADGALGLRRMAKCSTPFGIGDWFTVVPTVWTGRLSVCSTPFGIGDWFTWARSSPTARVKWCAQRLSASEIGSPLRSMSMNVCTDGAQRLSASEIGSRIALGASVASVLRVLNAFRHRRLVHPQRR